jgi:D-tyrosyl-tRNA(Tyr) deacylase
MRAVVQKVSSASVTVDGVISGEIGFGLLVLLGINHTDNHQTVNWMAKKLANLRIFPDDQGKMNKSVLEIDAGGILIISNFTVYGHVSNGFRPSFSEAARPDIAEPRYNQLVDELSQNYPLRIATGKFGAMMKVSLTNEGPVTLIIEKD